MKIDPLYCTEWEYIPHFLLRLLRYPIRRLRFGRGGEFTDAILKEGAPARDRFINMLKAGGSDYAYRFTCGPVSTWRRPRAVPGLVARMKPV